MTALPCCTPFHAAGAWRHARTCPSAPNAKLSNIDRAALRTARYMQSVADADPGAIDQAIGRLATWMGHEPGCSCPSCRYVEAHLDDEDDIRGPLANVEVER